MDLFGGSFIYACTNSGVYLCMDYFVGIENLNSQKESISIFPNPVKNRTTIKINGQKPINNDNSIIVYNNNGEKVDELSIPNSLHKELTIEWSKGNLPSGIYYLVLKNGKERLTEKFIIL